MKQLSELWRFCTARHGQPLALATLVTVHGSSYRQPGARMVIDALGLHAGGVSAGCIEDDVVACAADVLHDERPRLLKFDTRRRFGCHGTIEILVERVNDSVLAALHACHVRRQTTQLETIFRAGSLGTRPAGSQLRAGALVQTLEPPLRLIILGSGAETAPLASHAAVLGWEVLQFPESHLPAGLIDDRTAVLVANHHFGRDCAALYELLPRDIAYLGMVGSRRRREEVLFDVLQSGIAVHACLHAPAGLDLGAESPEEIALAIVAEIQCVFNAGSGLPLRERRVPIHQSVVSAASCLASQA